MEASKNKIPTELIGSIPRPPYLLGAPETERGVYYQRALYETLKVLEDLNCPQLTDGEQGKSSFITYPLDGNPLLDPEGLVIEFEDGHIRQLPKLKGSPFRYQTYAQTYLREAQGYTQKPLKQAVIAPSALSLIYPAEGLPEYSRDQFLDDLCRESERDIRLCLLYADKVQLDFTEARLALKLDPSGKLLQSFIDLNNRVLERFSVGDRLKLGVHVCPGGDWDSTHSKDVSEVSLIKYVFQLQVSSFYLSYKGEPNKKEILLEVRRHLLPHHKIFLGVTDVLTSNIETPEEIRDLILEASTIIPRDQLGTTDDCGFSPFADDISGSRDLAFAKIKARVEGTHLAEKILFQSKARQLLHKVKSFFTA